MQTFENDKLLSTRFGDPKELAGELEEQLSKVQATHAVIGKIPTKGDIIHVNGLKYKVKASDAIEGTFKARILKP